MKPRNTSASSLAASRPNELPRLPGSGNAPAEVPPARVQPISLASVRNSYRRYAPVYDWLFGIALHAGRRHMAALVDSYEAVDVLEVGVGTGLTLPMYPARARVVGIDLSLDMLRHARHRASLLDDRSICLLAMNAELMAFPDSSFDCITVPYVLSVTPDPGMLHRELRRVCRSGGRIIIVNHFSGHGRWNWAERILKRFSAFIGFRSDFSFEANVTRFGLDVESVHSTNLLGLSRVVVIRNG